MLSPDSMIILGINNMHDAASALMIDNQIVAAAEEERFCRRKHAKGFPAGAIACCLREGGLTLQEVDVVVASWRPWVLRVRASLAARSVLHSLGAFRSKAARGIRQMGHEWKELFTLRQLLNHHFGPGPYKLHYLEHHLAHAASALYCSPFEESAILTVDGAGEADTTVLWHGAGTTIRKLAATRLPHSLGQLYSATTAFLGFKVHHDEYKVMGLAAMGTPRFADYLRKNVITLLPNGDFRIKPYFLDYHLARQGHYSPEVICLFGQPRNPDEPITATHADVAASVQVMLEQALFHILRHLHEVTQSRNLCLAGGVALNCTANGKIFDQTPFENVFVHPAAGDDGTALGAALHVVNSRQAARVTPPLLNANLGPSFSLSECAAALARHNLAAERLADSEVVSRAARLLAEGHVIGWFQGRMEWGPRALGARSILADPRRPESKEKINRIIKKREPFRPFAPSILEEAAREYFVGYHPSPFMLFTFPVKADKVGVIPAVTHVDGTARPQGVTEEAAPRYYQLIQAFQRLTDVPVVLNTSFNVQEPIVCTPDDAVATFLGSEVDYLVLENFLVQKAKQ